MIDVNGKMGSYCDCSKKKMVTTTCIHRELVAAHGDGFLGSMTDLEEPQSYLICVDRETLMFSVASSSGSVSHHSHNVRGVQKPSHSGEFCSILSILSIRINSE
jgi:hypothetical protein